MEIGANGPLKTSVPYASAITLSHDQNNFSLEFSALSYFNPAANRYRYKLEGLDKEWNEVGSDQRVASYTTLPPRHYTFRVQGAVSRGLWSEPGASLRIDILAPYWETWWFRTACSAFLLGLLWLAYRLRLQRIAWQFNVRLEERIAERTRIARELHDTLLQSFQGLIYRFQAARNVLPQRPEEAIQTLDGAIARAAQAVAESRQAIRDLRPERGVQIDLAKQMTSIGEELAGSQDKYSDSANFRVTVEGTRHDLRPMFQDELYRIARELLRNAFEHAHARQIEAELRYSDRRLRLRIRDDGRGIDAKVLSEGGRAGHWGLPGIYERVKRIGGQLDVWSETGAGTEIELTVPASVAYARSPGPSRFSVFRRNLEDS